MMLRGFCIRGKAERDSRQRQDAQLSSTQNKRPAHGGIPTRMPPGNASIGALEQKPLAGALPDPKMRFQRHPGGKPPMARALTLFSMS